LTAASEEMASKGLGFVRRHAAPIQWTSALLIVAGLFALARALPIEPALQALQGWVERHGAAGTAVFVGVYVLAALLFVPGSALTIAAGALFGLWLGTALVSVAATTTAALAFLIARYLARGAVERKARANPRFGAIDRAITEGGWKIIALLRLSPAVPFSLGNYLFGLTAIGFWPYVLSSWIAMLPGTFLYVYLGHAGSAGLAAASSGEMEKGSGQWVLLGVGLLATIVVTVYVTRLARREIAKRTSIESTAKQKSSRKEGGSPRMALILAGVALVVVAAASLAWMKRDALERLFDEKMGRLDRDGAPPHVAAAGVTSRAGEQR
jgi:uncharacterized membrane protein YdjX (TVP38/TMEM64 family)